MAQRLIQSMSPQPRRNHDRRIRRKPFKSVFVRAPQVVNKYMLTSAEYAASIGCDERRIREWRERWLSDGYGPGVEPRNFSTKSDREYRYDFDQVHGLPEGTWLARFRAAREAYIKSNSVMDYDYRKNWKQTKE